MPAYKSRAFCLLEERLREKGGSRTEVLIGIVNPVRVELDLAIVEVEVRSVRENLIGLRIIAPIRPYHWKSRFTAQGELISSQS